EQNQHDSTLIMPSSHSAPSAHSNRSTGSATSIVSQTSTAEYEHEPFDQYVSKVQQLCRKLWPSATEDFEIERLKGGAFNRIIGITNPSFSDEGRKSYILRVPRFEDSQRERERELAIHRFVGERTSIPMAEIIFFDPTDSNPLGSPFVIQDRLLGTNLNYAYGSLTHEQRKTIVRQFGNILLALQAVKNATSGVVEAAAQEDGHCIYNVCRFDIASELVEDPEDPEDPVPSNDQTVLNMLLTQYKRWSTYSLQLDPNDVLAQDYYAQLSKIAREMNASGLFEDQPFYLTHLDLEPRNVLVETKTDAEASISGVLDWDSAVFAPIFASCRAPSWIWLWTDHEEEDEAKANEVPEDLELRELKQIFEETMGTAYVKYAYQPEYRMARFLFNVAKDGLRSSWIIHEAETIFKEWAEFTGSIDSPDAFIGCVAWAFEKTTIDEEGDLADHESDFDDVRPLQDDECIALAFENTSIDDVEGRPANDEPDFYGNGAAIPILHFQQPKQQVQTYTHTTTILPTPKPTLQQANQMPFHSSKSTTKHHCPKKGGREGNCRPAKTHCKEHQLYCTTHNASHLKTEPCPRCKTAKIMEEQRKKAEEAKERARREEEARQAQENRRDRGRPRHTDEQRQHAAGR
ncbi:MAG: hypothetical protein Q9184_005856, partial [Pyrenodesmia sp. 2 TL-2023]